MRKTKKIWTQADINSVIIEQDWDCEGALRIKNPKTYKRYEEMQDHLWNAPRNDKGIFFAFGNDQFIDGVKHLVSTGAIEPIEDFSSIDVVIEQIKGKVFHCYAGMYGTREGIKAYLKSCDENAGDVAGECNPMEVYVYEYNNHECMLSWDGDEEAIKIIISEYGEDVAKMIRRYNKMYSFEEIYQRAKRTA